MLILQTSLALQEVAISYGFNSAASFASAYRLRYGVSPRRGPHNASVIAGFGQSGPFSDGFVATGDQRSQAIFHQEPDTRLTTEQKDAYHRDGYLVVHDVVDKPTFARLRMLIADFRERPKSVARSDSVFDVGPSHSAVSPQLRRLKDPVRQHPDFDALLCNDAIVDIAADLMGGTARFDHSKLSFKPAGGERKDRVAPGLGLLSAHE